ncbi:hypothetical protein GUITHDRAFT_150585 [Guillardia theta CCMP2712]|uniref:Uncharacterized protein n=1 Tax=Guillardia theta (strain CCMP2712) TaxID=905079 RepID=L1JWS5_GUITC|nr:hypothetical protein GUITHDRAFT_150585 [Guillardia theta CCMP2712]EKX52563.1 hypothetical protein GUITHDRAFT_150585 [Guillardia theta CCMP2712]|eukprot:XP_005839543.1 hypothetical protein GUITHDRAFT_150585 [Guillardia theta CCMP2712]
MPQQQLQPQQAYLPPQQQQQQAYMSQQRQQQLRPQEHESMESQRDTAPNRPEGLFTTSSKLQVTSNAPTKPGQGVAELKQVAHSAQVAILKQQPAKISQGFAKQQQPLSGSVSNSANTATALAPSNSVTSTGPINAAPLLQEASVQKPGTLPVNTALAGQNPMLVDGQAADVGSLQRQAANEASKTLRKSLGTATPQQMSLRQQMQQQMLKKEESDAQGINGGELSMDDPVAQLGVDQTGLNVGNSLTHVKAAANPQLTRIGLFQ